MSVAEAHYHWSQASDYLRNAVFEEEPETFLRNVQARILSGISTLWTIEDEDGKIVAYAVTAIYTTDGLVNIAQIYLATASGLMPLIEQMDQFEVWAIKHNVSYIEILGRKGWEKVLRPHGFTYNHTSLLKRLNRELH